MDRPLLMDDSARASNPGRLRVKPFVWMSCYPFWPVFWAALLLAMVWLTAFVHWAFGIGVVVSLALNWLYWVHLREHFRFGCVNPAMVVSLDPLLIAVSSDLSKGIGSFPAIRIIRGRFATICGQEPKLGSRLATVSVYYRWGDANLPHWSHFRPLPVDCATDDLRDIQRIMESLDDESWAELMERLRLLEKPYRVGMYLLD
jgi:hypothetical protein